MGRPSEALSGNNAIGVAADLRVAEIRLATSLAAARLAESKPFLKRSARLRPLNAGFDAAVSLRYREGGDWRSAATFWCRQFRCGKHV